MASFEESVKYSHKQYVNPYIGDEWFKFYINLVQTCANILSKASAVAPGLANKEDDV